jgi:Ca-activated chloride channel family protein
MKTMIRMSWLVVVCALTTVTTYGAGMLIPKDGSVPPLAIKHQRVDISIKDGVATARIEQVFKNSTNRDLEAVYIFPLPLNAAIADFAMYIDGKRMSGELVEKDKARKIYQDIVRRMKDPGLLEHMGGTLFRVSVYPVKKNADQKIEIEYSQTLAFESGLYKYVYPLKTGDKAAKTLEDFTVSARIHSNLPIKNIYSPSHDVGISRKGEHEAVLGFEQEQALLDKDFVLYYGVSKKDFGLNLISHAVKGQEGFFMMMLAPNVVPDDATVMKKDVTFVLDTSGSMTGKKIVQARKALAYCVRKLNPGDRFNIIRFSTDVEYYKPTLVTVDEKSIAAAIAFIDDIEARGGTDINGALAAALRLEYDEKRPSIIAFLTDGKPTIGESDTDTIVGQVAKGNASKARVFVFGVGEKVNTHLLDKISGENGGLSQYVKPEEDIEVKLSSFSDKMSNPVLSNLAIAVDKVKVKQLHPRTLPDLFAGDQITVFGRYKGGDHVAIHLTGEVNGENREFVYEATFHETQTDNAFIPRLWATRRVGYLLDEIRLNGEQAELKDEVLKLSKEYGIMTPYTSYLVLENEQAYKTHGIDRPAIMTKSASGVMGKGRRSDRALEASAKPSGVSRRWGLSRLKSADRAPASGSPRMTVPVFDAEAADDLAGWSAEGEPEEEKRARVVFSESSTVDSYFKKESGSEAVELSEAIRGYRESDRSEDEIGTAKHIGDRLFLFIGGRWVDSKYKKAMKTITVKFADDAYFKLLFDHPELKSVFALGEKVTVVLEDDTAVVVE